MISFSYKSVSAMYIDKCSVSSRLSERFQLTAITLGKTIAPASGFHHQIVHSFG